jgi:nucleoside 2-deoxyribosyltransferase
MSEKIYLAGRYSRRAELAEYARDLERCGATITATWLGGRHEAFETGRIATDEMKAAWAKEDLYDIAQADTLLLFTDSEPVTRGGAFVEFGYALAAGKNIGVIGPKTHVFCFLPEVCHWLNWGSTPWMQKAIVDVERVHTEGEQ